MSLADCLASSYSFDHTSLSSRSPVRMAYTVSVLAHVQALTLVTSTGRCELARLRQTDTHSPWQAQDATCRHAAWPRTRWHAACTVGRAGASMVEESSNWQTFLTTGASVP